MNSRNDDNSRKWAQFRFSVVGPLLSSPPDPGSLADRIRELSVKKWDHPISKKPHHAKFSTIERWYYDAKDKQNPVAALERKLREDRGNFSSLLPEHQTALREQFREHRTWNYKLHADNLQTQFPQNCPSYDTIRRYMKAKALIPQKRKRNSLRKGAKEALSRLEKREVRSYEVSYVGGLWHLDFHYCSRQVLTRDGSWVTPKLCAVMDDHSRLLCHAQWYLSETTQDLVHCYIQALLKRKMPRKTMSDNGSAMTADEFTGGLMRLGIEHDMTLPYSPWQNGKQEFFFSRVESRLIPMLDGVKDLDLVTLNNATQAWIEQEYNRTVNRETGSTPYDRYIKSPRVLRETPSMEELRFSFCVEQGRRQRKSDGTVSIEGKRYEVPGMYNHLDVITVRYARWDLSNVYLIDKARGKNIARLYPLDRTANASGRRRKRCPEENSDDTPSTKSNSNRIAPLLAKLMADYCATGLPPAYIPASEITEKQENKHESK